MRRGPSCSSSPPQGKLEVTVDKVFPLDQAAEAHRYLQSGHAHGKVVLVP